VGSFVVGEAVVGSDVAGDGVGSSVGDGVGTEVGDAVVSLYTKPLLHDMTPSMIDNEYTFILTMVAVLSETVNFQSFELAP